MTARDSFRVAFWLVVYVVFGTIVDAEYRLRNRARAWSERGWE